MSTPAPVPSAPTGMPTWVKWLLGLSAGCLALVLLCCLGTCWGGKRMFGDLFGKMQKVEADRGLARAASERVAALDLEYPPAFPEDAGAAEVSAEDVDRYLRVRRALEPAGAAYQQLEDSAIPDAGGSLGMVRGMVGLFGAAADAHSARRALLEAAEPALRAEKMGPTDLARLAEIIEWRFLRREQARFLGLPEPQRREYQQMRLEERMLAAWTGGSMPPGMRINERTKADAERDLVRLREKLAQYAATADGRTALTATTTAVLEARRADLQALAPAGLQAMTPLTAEPPLAGLMDGSHDIRIEDSHVWGTSGASGHDGAPAPAGDEPPPSGSAPAVPADAPAGPTGEAPGPSAP